MFKEYLRNIDGIELYPMYSLVVFFLFFAGLSLWLLVANNNKLKELAEIPFKDNDSIIDNK